MKTIVKMPIGLGICSSVMMFMTITMVSLMSLILMTTTKEARLCEESIEVTKAYYKAEARANTKLLEIEEIYEIYSSAQSSREDVLEQVLKEIEGVTQVEIGEKFKIYYEVPIDKQQFIEVVATLPVQLDEPLSGVLQILSWKISSNE